PAAAATAPTPETIAEVEPVVAPGPARTEPSEPAEPAGPTESAEPAVEAAAQTGEPAEADPALQAVADLVGAPMPIEYHDGAATHQAVLTPQGCVRVGERTVATIEQAARVVGGEPARAWHDWHVAGFPMAEARAEATGTALPSARGRRARRGGAGANTVPGPATRH